MNAPSAAALDPAVASVGPVHAVRIGGGRTVRYVDRGRPGAAPFVFLGGMATSVGALGLTELACPDRDRLGLRAISVERNGFGATPLDSRLGIADAAQEILAVLDRLAVAQVSVVAVSGGGPFAAALAAAAPERVRTLHLVVAVAGCLITTHGTAAAQFADPLAVARDPAAMWTLEPGSPLHAIPGFAAAARAEGRRAMPDPERGARAVAHEWRLVSGGALPDLRAVHAPAHLYTGAQDAVVPRVHGEAWRAALPGPVSWREYPGEGHEVPYRHWDDVLSDVASA